MDNITLSNLILKQMSINPTTCEELKKFITQEKKPIMPYLIKSLAANFVTPTSIDIAVDLAEQLGSLG
jgi:hypothetical protein